MDCPKVPGRLVLTLLFVVPASVSCGADAQDDNTVSGDVAMTQDQAFRFRSHHHRPAGGTGGFIGAGGSSATGGAETDGVITTTDCDVCTKANACCEVVSGGPLCTFDSGTCASESANAQAAYVNACRTLLTTVSAAWSGKPPPACL